MNISCGIETKVKGIINIKLIRKGVCHTDLTFENLILDTFFARFANNNTVLGSLRCYVGSGTTPPQNSDTALVSTIAQLPQTSSVNNPASLDNINNRVAASRNHQFEFPQGSVVGNLGEIGFVFAADQGGTQANILNSRSLIKDAFGTPTPLTVTADDQLVVNYTFQLFIPMVDYVSNIQLGGNNYAVLGRVSSISGILLQSLMALPINVSFLSYASDTVFGDHGVNPSRQSGTNASTATSFLNVAAGTKDYEITASINQFNASGGIGAIGVPSFQGGTIYKYQFTPPIPKTNQNVLKLRFRYTCVRA